MGRRRPATQVWRARLRRRWPWLGAALSIAAVGSAAGQARPGGREPRYLQAIAEELEALRLSPRCAAESATRGTCRWSVAGERSGRTFELGVVYDDTTDTAYLWVDRYATAPPGAPHTPALLARAMELNWQLLVGKLEWNPTDGEVRLSTVINTDSNFDRRAFRSAVHALGALADRHARSLREPSR